MSRLPKVLDALDLPQFLQPTKVWPEVGKREDELTSQANRQQQGLGHPMIAEFEKAYKINQGLPDCFDVFACTNGTHAIRIALEALNIGAFQTILIPALTWTGTGKPALDTNANVVPIDLDEDGVIDTKLVRRYLNRTRGTKRYPRAIIVVGGLYDRGAHLEELYKICREEARKGCLLFLIEDNAHAAGAVIDGRPAGSWGVLATSSLQSSKPLTTNEGGVVMTAVPLLKQRLTSGISCGRPADPFAPADEVDEVVEFWIEQVAKLGLKPEKFIAGNDRFPGLSAAYGLGQLKRFPEQFAAREATLKELEDLLPTVPGIKYRRQPHVQRPVAYMLAFQVDWSKFAGMDIALFCEVLHYLLGEGEFQLVLPSYRPLAGPEHAEEYDPRSLQRHHLSEEYLELNDPAKYEAPVAYAFMKSLVTIQHSFLRETGAAKILVKALLWMLANAKAIVAAANAA